MLSNRTRGLLRLQGLLIILILPLWFLLNMAFGVEVLGKISYNQFNYSLYLMGIFGVCLVRFNPYSRHLNRSARRQEWVQTIRQTNADIIAMALVLFAIVFATKDKAISRVFLAYFIIDTWVLLLIINRWLIHAISSIVFSGKNKTSTILLGSPKTASRMSQWISNQPPIGIDFVGLITLDDNDDDEAVELPIPVLGNVSIFDKILRERQISQVILLESRSSKAWVTFVLDMCQREGARLLIFNQWEDFLGQQLTPVSLGTYNFLTLQDEPLENPLNRILKRVLDIIVALPVVLFFLPPLCLIVKWKQFRQSPGPLFFRQKRAGFHGGVFEILKFRSMSVRGMKETEEKIQAGEEDDRIYPFGRFLRRASLDEFPQFWNVLIGTMSVVGPRPHLLEHDNNFRELVSIYRSRQFVRPGITGLAQSKGYRGEIRKIHHLSERIRLDIEYVTSWSIWLDMGIILRTFFQIFFPPKSAY